METNPDIYLVTADLGMGMWDKIRDDFPDRFLNTGASEQAASDICVGLALSGKIPVFYSITPFLLYRCFETLRTYINHEELHVILVGSGRDDDYKHDGFSHDATDDILLFNHEAEGDCEDVEVNGILDKIKPVWPTTNVLATQALANAISDDKPWYINLTR